MNQPVTFQGRSFLFNAIFVLLNLVGLTFVVMGFHQNFEEYKGLFIAIGLVLISLTTTGLIIFHGRIMMAGVSRVLVGALCIVSGLVKANDPIGFSYKLEEYFEDGALAYRIKEWFGSPGFSLEFLIDYALIISVVICLAEIVLGVLLIIGGKIKLVSYLVLFMMLFFTFLTWHTANCDSKKKFIDRDTYAMSDPMALIKIEEAKNNKSVKIISKTSDYLVVDEEKSPQCVSDCGCFGDALKGSVGRSLTPNESYWKDLILVYLVLWIFMSQWITKPNNRQQNLIFSISAIVLISFFSWVFGWYFPILFGILVLLGALWILRAGGKLFANYGGAAFIVAFISMFFITYVLMYEPLKDYRPFAVGNNLIEKMHDGVEGVFENVMIYKNKKTGKVKEIAATDKEFKNPDFYLWTDANWVYKDRIDKTIVEARSSSLADFEPSIDVEDVGKEELTLKYVQAFILKSKIEGIKIQDLTYNSTMEIPIGEYNLTDYPAVSYKIVDTVEMTSQEVTDINIKNLIMSSDDIVVLTCRNVKDANWKEIEKFKEIYQGCKSVNIPFIVICNSSREDINAFRKKYHFDVPVFINDEIMLKAIARSNPSLMVIGHAIVKGKYPHRSLPTFDWLQKNILKKK